MEKLLKNIKIKLTENELEEVIGNVLEALNIQKNVILQRDILGECLNNYIICEGLIKSFSKDDVFKILNNFNVKKYNINVIGIPFFLYKNKKKEIPYQIYIQFNNGLTNISEIYFNDIIKIMDNLGWYYSTSNNSNNIADYSQFIKYKSFTLIFEPKFDVLLSSDEIPLKLYHITKSNLVNKIMTKGIQPKSFSMFTNHPERVYLFLNKVNEWKLIANNFRRGKNIEDKFVLLEIDGNGLNKSNKIFIDQNSNFEKACFTLEPIPPNIIKLIEEE